MARGRAGSCAWHIPGRRLLRRARSTDVPGDEPARPRSGDRRRRLVVWESARDPALSGGPLRPRPFWADGPGERARIDGWMDWSQTVLQPDFLMGVFWGFYRTPEAQRDWPAIRNSSRAAPVISGCWTDCWRIGRFWLATSFRLRTFRPAPRSTAISRSRSSVRGSPRGRLVSAAAGTAGLSRARHAPVRGALLWPASIRSGDSGGRSAAREPGIHNHRPVDMDFGFAPSARPGMTPRMEQRNLTPR